MKWIAKAGAAFAAVVGGLLAIQAGCGSDEGGSGPGEDAGDPDAPGAEGGFPPSAWEYKTYECPAPTGSFPPGTDKWSPLVNLRQKGTGQVIPPIHIVLLSNGRVLMPGANMRTTPDAGVISGTSNFIITPDEPAADMTLEPQEIGSPHLGAGESLFCTGHAPLEDGRYLMAGGNKEGYYCSDGGTPPAPDCVEALLGLDYAYIFDPATESFSIIDQKMVGGRRWYPTTTRMPDGTLIVTAGDIAAELAKNHSVELFDPATSSFTMLSDEANTPKEVEITAHYVHVYVLPKPITAEARPRQTLVMGEGGHMFLFSAERDFQGAPRERWARRAARPGPISPAIVLAHGASGIMMPLVPRNEARYNQGSVLVIGGSEDRTKEQSAEFYDPYQDKWCPIVDLGIPRFQPSTVLLPDGNILIMAGTPWPTVYGLDNPQRAPQILDPRTGAVWNGSPWPDPYTRGYHNTVLLLPDGRVIVAGGRTFEGGDPDITTYWDERPDMRYYYPPYFGPILAGKPRPVIDAVAPETMGYDTPTTVSYTNGPIDMVSIVGLGAQTHCVDMNARHVQLDYVGGQAEGGTITVKGPLDRNTAPPGPYMLFLMHKIDGWMVPSVAKVITVR